MLQLTHTQNQICLSKKIKSNILPQALLNLEFKGWQRIGFPPSVILSLSSELSPFNLGSPKADPKAGIWMSFGKCRKYKWGCGEVTQRREDSQKKGRHQASSHCGCLELHPTEKLWKPCRTHTSVLPCSRGKVTTPPAFGGGLLIGSVNSLALRECSLLRFLRKPRGRDAVASGWCPWRGKGAPTASAILSGTCLHPHKWQPAFLGAGKRFFSPSTRAKDPILAFTLSKLGHWN